MLWGMPRAFVLLVCLLSCSAWAAGHGSPDDPKPGYLYGKVVGITDGDTLTLLTPDRRQVKIRLAEIDTPEKNQPYGSKSRQALADLVFQKNVAVRYVDTDRYGRTVGRIHAGDVDVNAELVRQGAAWVYRKYASDASLYALEDEARSSGRGLWSLPEAQRIPPWEWRRGSRVARSPVDQPEPSFACGTKTYCREMASCEEAYFYLQQCALTRLDGDGDGMPCEAMCR